MCLMHIRKSTELNRKIILHFTELNLTNYAVGGGRDVCAFFKSTMRFTCDFLSLHGDYAGLLEEVIKVSSSDGYTKEHIIT